MILTAPAAHAAAPRSYAALGDSYTAAPLIAPPSADSAAGCFRNHANYPSLVAQALQIGELRDASCSGATTAYMTAAQLDGQGPQFASLSSDVELVTIGIGFNDARLSRVITECPIASLLVVGPSCRSRYAAGGQDAILADIHATGPKVAAMLRSVHDRAPQARVLLVGYPQMVPNDGRTCFPTVPLSADDNRYFDSLIQALNATLRGEAASGDAEFVDMYARSAGHDMCTSAGTKWWEGAIISSAAFPWHPNGKGAQAMAGAILEELNQPRPAPVLSELAAVRRRIKQGRKARFTFKLDRPARATFTVSRGESGRRSGGRCQPARASNRTRSKCTRWTRPVRTLTRNARKGENLLALGAQRMNSPALYRLTATARAGDTTSAVTQAYVRVG
ncbi:MAG: hypothetical protein QOG15_2800 [Solirubrobacteraceae bacterium]|jgi:lysophospholipase L1-like esterase|nr:hypothetical protein [Solirubrobacteraceae bacterium]